MPGRAGLAPLFSLHILPPPKVPPYSPKDREDLRLLLDTHLLEKAVYELVYELNNRPGWVRIPLSGIAQLVG